MAKTATKLVVVLILILIPIFALAQLTHKLHSPSPRPWGYEIPVTFIGDTGYEHNIIMLFPKLPTKVERDEMISFWETKIQAEVEPILDEMISKIEVEQLLIDKGYLQAGQKLEDLLDKEAEKL